MDVLNYISMAKPYDLSINYKENIYGKNIEIVLTDLVNKQGITEFIDIGYLKISSIDLISITIDRLRKVLNNEEH